MSTSTASAPAKATTPDLSHSGDKKWKIGYIAAIGITFVFYQYLFDYLPDSVQDIFQDWLPLVSVNEALVWVICAVGLNIVVGYAGLLDLGFVAFWAIGGYCAGWFMSQFFLQVNIHVLGSVPSDTPGIHLSFWLVLVAAGLVCSFFGILIGAPTLRLKSDYLAIVTLGFGEIIPQIFVNGEDINGFNLSNGTKGINPLDPIQFVPGVTDPLGPFDLAMKFLIYSIVAVFVVFISLRIREGRLGRAWLAIREDELAATMMGVPLMKTKLAAYAVGAFCGGLGGAVYATHINGVLPDRFNFSISIILLAMVVLGGMGNVWGVVSGALLLAWINSTGLPRTGDAINDALGTNFNFPAQTFLIFGLMLVLMMLFRREGLFPETRTAELVKEPERGELEAVGADLEGDIEEERL